MVTADYKLADINQGYADLLDGKNVRGMPVLIRLLRQTRSDHGPAHRRTVCGTSTSSTSRRPNSATSLSATRSRSCPVAHTDADDGYYNVTRFDDIRTICENPDDRSARRSPACGTSRCACHRSTRIRRCTGTTDMILNKFFAPSVPEALRGRHARARPRGDRPVDRPRRVRVRERVRDPVHCRFAGPGRARRGATRSGSAERWPR